jgi:hypothetical protein
LETDLIADGVELLQVKTLGPAQPDAGCERTRRFYLHWGCGLLLLHARTCRVGALRRSLLTLIYQSDITLIDESEWPDTKAAGGIPMNAQNGNTAAKGLRGWWRTPSRPGLQRLIIPWEYRHLRFFGVTRIAGGSLAAAAGLVCLAYGVYPWAAFFLVIGALNLAGGYWELTIARSAPART